MKRCLQIMMLRVAIVALGIPLALASGTTWQLEAVRARFQTKLHSLSLNES